MTSEVRPARVSRRRALHGRLGLRVEVRRGLVEHHHVGRLEHEAGQGDPLLLPAREAVAAFADHRVEPVGQVGHEVTDLGLGQGGLHLRLRRVGAGVHQVGPQRVVEEVRILGHHADDVTDRCHGGMADVDAAQLTEPPVTS